MGPGGKLWFAGQDAGGTWAIGSITTSGAITRFHDPAINNVEGVTAGPDGALWFTNTAANSIGRMTTAGAVTSFTDSSISHPGGITTGPDGALWFTDRGEPSPIEPVGDGIGRITTTGVVSKFDDPGLPRTLAHHDRARRQALVREQHAGRGIGDHRGCHHDLPEQSGRPRSSAT